MSVPILPNFTGNPQSANDLLEYLTDPTNAGLLNLQDQIDVLTTALSLKTTHYRQEAPPTSANGGDLWTVESTKITSYCHTTYETGEPAPDVKWTELTDGASQSLVSVVAQVNSPVPQVGLLSSEIQGMASDNIITSAEKTTLKILHDELVQRKIEIDQNAIRYDIASDQAYTDYTTSYTTWASYITSTGVLNDLNSDSTLSSMSTDSSTWNSIWSDIITKEGAISTLIRSSAQDLIDTINGNQTSTQAQVDEMTADGVVSPTEKLRFRDEWVRIQDEYATLVASVTDLQLTGASQYTSIQTSYNALFTYLGTTTAVFSDMTTATTLTDVGSNSTEWQAKWQAYYADSKALDTYVDSNFKSQLEAQDQALQTQIDSLSDLANDGVISGGSEKQTAKSGWDEITRLHARALYQASVYGVSTPSAYTTAYDDLNTYLNTTIDLFNDLTTNTAVTRSVYNSKFSDFYFQYDTFTDLITDAQKSAVDSDPADYANFKALIESVVDDGVISAGMEKTRMNAIWLDIQATHSVIVLKASSASTDTSALVTAYNDLDSYIGTLTAPGGSTPNFTIEGEDTAIGVSTFYSKLRTYESAKAQLESAIISQIINLQADASKGLLDINDDGIVSTTEKGTVYREWNRLTAERNQLDTQAGTLGITTARNTMNTDYTALETYLNSLDSGAGLFNDLSTATVLTQVEKDAWDTTWNTFFASKAGLETEIVSSIQGNVDAVSSSAFRKDGSVPATGDFDLANYNINNLLPKTLSSGGLWGATTGQVYTEQQARLAHNLANNYASNGSVSVHGIGSSEGEVVGTAKAQTLTQKTINADNNTISELEVDNLKAGVVEADVLGSTTPDDSTIPSTKATKDAIAGHASLTDNVHGLAEGSVVVGADDIQALTNKTIDGSLNTLTNIPFSALLTSDISTNIGFANNDFNQFVSATAVKNYVDSHGGGGGGGGGGVVDLEWVTVGNAETTNTGSPATVATGTLTLPAGKTWKWIEICYMSFANNGGHTDSGTPIAKIGGVTQSFVVSSMKSASGDSGVNSKSIAILKGAPSTTDSDITIDLEWPTATGSTADRHAYIVGIAGGNGGQAEEYGVYLEQNDQSSGSASFTTGLIGTRIDVSDSNYNTSSFKFDIKGTIGQAISGESDDFISQNVLHFTGTIKKSSGGEPFGFIVFSGVYGNNSDQGGKLSGSLTSNLSKIDDGFTAQRGYLIGFDLERIDQSNELCFRFNIEWSSAYTQSHSVWVSLTGPRTYNGTLISSSNGTEF